MSMSLRRNRPTPERRRRRRDETILRCNNVAKSWVSSKANSGGIQKAVCRDAHFGGIQKATENDSGCFWGSMDLIQQRNDDDDKTKTIATKYYN